MILTLGTNENPNETPTEREYKMIFYLQEKSNVYSPLFSILKNKDRFYFQPHFPVIGVTPAEPNE
jgi:hypothetical protein